MKDDVGDTHRHSTRPLAAQSHREHIVIDSNVAIKKEKDERTSAMREGRDAGVIQPSAKQPEEVAKVEQENDQDQSGHLSDMTAAIPHEVQTDSPPRRPRLRIAIAGGGIGGLALATFLATSSASLDSSLELEVSIYEAAPSLTELGAGVGVWLRTWRILSSAGLADDLERIAPAGRDMSEGLRKAFDFRRGDRAFEGRSFYTMEVPFGVLTLHRADFQHALARHAIPPAQPHFGKRLTGYGYADEKDPSSDIILKFADGSTARANILVGADGIRSVVRREVVHRLFVSGSLKLEAETSSSTSSNKGNVTVITEDSRETGSTLKSLQIDGPEQFGLGKQQLDALSDLTEPVWSGTVVYRNLIPLAALEARFPGHRAGRGPVVFFGRNQHVLAFPLSAGGSAGAQSEASANATSTPMVNLVAFTSDPARENTRLPPGEAWVRPAPREELLEKFKGWEDEVLALLELAEKPLLWAIHTVKPLPCYSDADGRVVLLGDAAHAMTPHQGAGGGQAIEDAHVLAALLAHPRTTRGTLPTALRAYDAVRVPVAQRVVRSSRLNGMMYELNHAWDTSVSGSVEENHHDMDTDRDPDPELARLHRLADAIMEIHKWEWEDEPAESQPAQAVRLFEKFLTEKAEGRSETGSV